MSQTDPQNNSCSQPIDNTIKALQDIPVKITVLLVKIMHFSPTHVIITVLLELGLR